MNDTLQNTAQLLELFLDLDGVVVDYTKGYLALGGDLAEKGKRKAERFKAVPHFYRNLEWMLDGKELWDFVKQFDPSILSASSNYLKFSKQDKHDWVDVEMGMTGPKVIVVAYPTDKQKHCKPGAVLIDDNLKNCTEWENAGGVAILHTSAADTIQKLKNLLESRKGD